MSAYKPEILVNGTWSRNGCTFQTYEEALASAKHIYSRWMLAEDFRAAESDETPNYEWTDSGLKLLKPANT